MKNKDDRENKILAVSYISIIANCFLSLFKLIAGLLGNSISMVSDAIHSISDVASTFVVIFGVKLSNKISDDDHQYGHERLESVMSIVLATMLLIVGLGIGETGIKNLFNYGALKTPSLIALIAAIVSILVKEGMYWLTIIVAKQTKSSMLKADAWHHRSDALSSIGSLIGIIGARCGYIWTDSVASIIICIVIVKIALDIFKESFGKLVDKACDNDTKKKIYDKILNIDGVKNIDDLKTRMFADKIYVDVEIAVDGTLTVYEGHNIAQKVHDDIENLDDRIKHCMVHINPI